MIKGTVIGFVILTVIIPFTLLLLLITGINYYHEDIYCKEETQAPECTTLDKDFREMNCEELFYEFDREYNPKDLTKISRYLELKDCVVNKNE